MIEDNFDPNMTYRQTLAIVTRGLIQWPTTSLEVSLLSEACRDCIAAALNVAWYLALPLLRLLALLLLPLSAPFFAVFVQADRRKTARAMEEVKQRVYAHYSKNIQDTDKGGKE